MKNFVDNTNEFYNTASFLEEHSIYLPIIQILSPILPGMIHDIPIFENQYNILENINSLESTILSGYKKAVFACKNTIITDDSTSGLSIIRVATFGHVIDYEKNIHSTTLYAFIESRCFITDIKKINNIYYAKILPAKSTNIKSFNDHEIKEITNKYKNILLHIIHNCTNEKIKKHSEYVLKEINHGLSIWMACDLCLVLSENAKYEDKVNALCYLDAKSRTLLILKILSSQIENICRPSNSTMNYSSDVQVMVKTNCILEEIESEIESKIFNNKFPENILRFIDVCKRRLKILNSNSLEFQSCLDHLQTIINFPWKVEPSKHPSIKHIKKILDIHIGEMVFVKNRIIEIMSLNHMNPKIKLRPICLIGSAGIGKTSIAHAIAIAIDRPFIKISLCGLTDVAILRGTKKTYVGSTYGKIAQAVQDCAASRPVILLDEIDKIDFNESNKIWASIMEAIDPSHNNHYLDFYLDCHIDISDIFFIATANSCKNIPKPLIDRFEIIEIPDYTQQEKFKIFINHILPKMEKYVGIPFKKKLIKEEHIIKIIEHNVHSSIRDMEKIVLKIFQKHAKKIILKEKGKNFNAKESINDIIDEIINTG